MSSSTCCRLSLITFTSDVAGIWGGCRSIVTPPTTVYLEDSVVSGSITVVVNGVGVKVWFPVSQTDPCTHTNFSKLRSAAKKKNKEGGISSICQKEEKLNSYEWQSLTCNTSINSRCPNTVPVVTCVTWLLTLLTVGEADAMKSVHPLTLQQFRPGTTLVDDSTGECHQEEKHHTLNDHNAEFLRTVFTGTVTLNTGAGWSLPCCWSTVFINPCDVI